MYFFPDKKCASYFENCLLIKNTIDEFFIECDLKLDDPLYLLEGYLYGSDEKKHFLITDILFKGNTLVECDYTNRLQMINDLFINKIDEMKNINNILSIGIHNSINNYLLKVFLNNFIWKNELIGVEVVRNFEKNQKFLNEQSEYTGTIQKVIRKSKTSDIYNVYNLITNDSEGLLYINTLKMSKHLNSLFKNNEQLTLNCCFNKNFQKWQVVQ